MINRRPTTTSLGMTLACCGLALALSAPAEAGGRGGRGGHGHHGSVRSHGSHGSVGYRGQGHYRTSGRYYRHGGSHGSYSHRGRGVYGPYVGVYGYGYRSRSYAPRHVDSGYPSYRPYLPSPAFYQGYVNHLPYPVGYETAYVDAAPVYEPAPAPAAAAPAQTIYIVLQPPAEAAAPPAYEAADPEPPAVSAGGAPGKVHLAVEPRDAAVYLDDDLLGSGEEIAGFGEPLSLSSGVHVLEVLHPGHPPQRLVFGVPAAGELRVEVDLDGDRRGRKAQVKALDHGPVEPGG